MALIHPLQITKFNFASSPTVTDDVDSGYSPSNIWVNTTSDDAFICVDNSAGAAIWTLITNDFRNMNYSGVVDASDTGTDLAALTAAAQTGDWYLVSATGGTQDFDGEWATYGNTSAFPGATFEVGDAILFNGTTWDKVDNTEIFAAQQTYVAETTSAATPTSGAPVVYTSFFTSPPPAATKDVTVTINGVVIDYNAVSIATLNLQINTTTLGYPIPPSSLIQARWVAA